jgi:hypothetical protein
MQVPKSCPGDAPISKNVNLASLLGLCGRPMAAATTELLGLRELRNLAPSLRFDVKQV